MFIWGEEEGNVKNVLSKQELTGWPMCDCDGQNLSNPAVKQCFKLVSKWPARHSDWFVSTPVCGVNLCYS